MECLVELERLSKLELIDLYYGDESRVSIDPCVPYGWQFKDEKVFMPSSKGAGLNCFALLSRASELRFETTRKRVTSEFIIEQLERLSFSIKKVTVLVLDKARVHIAESTGAAQILAATRIIHLLLAAILAASEYSREVVAQAEIRVVAGIGLRKYRWLVLSSQTSIGASRQRIEDSLL